MAKVSKVTFVVTGKYKATIGAVEDGGEYDSEKDAIKVLKEDYTEFGLAKVTVVKEVK
jgi:hypothetical protein